MSERMDLGAVSAYAIAVENGFEGTEAEWLESLKGASGDDGISPVANVTRVDGGVKISVTDANGTTEAIVENGEATKRIEQNLNLPATQNALDAHAWAIMLPFVLTKFVIHSIDGTEQTFKIGVKDKTDVGLSSITWIDENAITGNEYTVDFDESKELVIQTSNKKFSYSENVYNGAITEVNSNVKLQDWVISGDYYGYKIVPIESTADALFNKNILVFGDSMAAGSDLSGEHIWLGKICKRVKANGNNKAVNGSSMAHTSSVSSQVTANQSVWSHICDSNSAYYTDEVSNPADYIIVYAGTNDIRGNTVLGSIDSTEPETFYGALKDICKNLQDRWPMAHIGFITPYNTQDDSYGDYKSFVDAIKTVCANFAIPVFDNLTMGGINWKNEHIRASLTENDTYHLNEAGHEFVSYKYESFLRSI